MKKSIVPLILLIFFSAFQEMQACDAGAVPYISGPAEVEQNQVYQYTLIMHPDYKASTGGYVNTQWTLQGKGVIGHGETINMNTANFAYGTYTLIAKNQFGSSDACFGCLTNTTFSYTFKVVPPKPDLIVECPYFDSNTNNLDPAPTAYNITVKARNIGDAPSNWTKVTITWTRGTTSIVDSNVTFESIQPNGSITTERHVIAPSNASGATQEWTLTFKIDPNDDNKEKDETNNTKVYKVKVNSISSGRIATSSSVGDETNLLFVTDLLGNPVWKKGDGPFNASGLRSGAYIYKTINGGHVHTKKIFRD
jgi:hypothetical protein